MNERAELIPASEMVEIPSDAAPQMISDSAQVLAVITKAATDPTVDIDKMERLMKLYNEREQARAEREFNAAMMAVQQEMPRIKRDADNKQTHSSYARLETVNAALIPVYTKHGFSLSFGTAPTDVPDTIMVTCRVSHIGGHSYDREYPSPITTTGIAGNAMMTRAHGSGSALSYGRRYLTLMIFNASMTDEDDDGNAATPAEPPPKIGPKRKRKIIDGMLDCLRREDGAGLLQITEELENDEKQLIWGELRSWERTEITALLTKAKADDKGDPNYIEPLPTSGEVNLVAWSVTALQNAKDLNGVESVWKAVKAAFKGAGKDVPLDTNTIYNDRKAELTE